MAIRDVLTRLNVIEKVATAHAEAGDVEAALKAVEAHLPTYIDKGWAIQSIAIVQARRGDVEGVRAWSSNQDPDLRSRALLGVAQRLVAHSQ